MAKFRGPSLDAGADQRKCAHEFNVDVGGLDHLYREGCINDITAGETKVKPAAGGRTDVFRHIGREGDDIVVERAFELFTAVQTQGGARLDLLEIFFGDQAIDGKGFTGEQLNLEPDFEFALFAPDFPHHRPRVALDHEEP